MDVIWRIFEFDIAYHCLYVELLQFHVPGQQYVIFNNRNEFHQVVNAARERTTMLIGWFAANIEDTEARRYTYAAFPTYYVWNKSLKKRTKRKQRVCIR